MKEHADKNCEICGAHFTDVARLMEHSRVHSKARPFKCDLCDCEYKSPKALKDHWNFIHSIKNRCSYCKKYCEDYLSLTRHQCLVKRCKFCKEEVVAGHLPVHQRHCYNKVLNIVYAAEPWLLDWL